MEGNITLSKDNFFQKKIDDYKFINNENLVEVYIPFGVTSIGERAFSKCKNLKKLVLPDSITHIGPSAFSDCENLEEVVIPKSIKKLNYRTFAGCKRLKKVILPDGLEELDWGVFAGCENLEEIVLPESITYVGKQLFLNCKKLKKVNIPNQIKVLPNEFFKGCKLLDIILNSNIKNLGNGAFEKCYSLTYFPEHVESFGDNCFKNCKSLTDVTINSKVTFLPSGMFDGCLNLNNINYMGTKLFIGERCFRNCRSLSSIPNYVKNLNVRAFENCTKIQSIDVIWEHIPSGCFRDCKNLTTINNSDLISSLGSFAFSGCTSLEELAIKNVSIIPAEAFSNCKNLKKIELYIGTSKIGSRAFYNCYELQDINLSDCIDTIKKEAFRNCRSIKKLVIPANLNSFEDGAFSFMDSLECIEVSPYNKTFMTPDNQILINEFQQKLVLYASGLKDKAYSLKDYNIELDWADRELVKPLTYIGEYAFAGAKHLEELTVCACTSDIESSAFYGCENLKKLNVEAISLFTCPGFHIREHGRYYFEGNTKAKAFLPFETVSFIGDVVQIFPGALQYFNNVKILNLPTTQKYGIGGDAFSDCELLESVNVPKQVTSVSMKAFNKNTNIIFENGISSKGFLELANSSNYIGDHKLYSMDNGMYYIEQGDKIISISKQIIDETCSHSEFVNNNPALFIDFMNGLINHDLAIKLLFNGILMLNITQDNRKILFHNLKRDDKFALNVLKHSGILDNDDSYTTQLLKSEDFKNVFMYIGVLKKYNIDNQILYNKIFMVKYDIRAFESLIKNDLDLFIKTVVDSKLLECNNITLVGDNLKEDRQSYFLTNQILQNNTLANFINLVKKYKIKDKYLFQKHFIGVAQDPLFEKLLKVYDANTKRLLKYSDITDKSLGAIENTKDLLILMEVLGALDEDPIIRQRAATFIVEKLFLNLLPNNKANSYRIAGDDIHRVFNFPYIREEFDKEFADFFIENYKEIIEKEKVQSGFIQRIYLNFREISRTSTSDKGFQRQLKVTLEKCINFLSTAKFDDVNEENKDFAKLIGAWYDNNSDWINAQIVYRESLFAPRNIFTKIEIDEDGIKHYDNNPEHDLKEPINENFSYEWLPKQSYDNLILGKYCNCCAHVNGAGRGIMRASMILDNCQNLVIRNECGLIIAKATLHINKEEGYGVFNTFESSFNYKEEEQKEKICNAFLRGAEAFIETYNENNVDQPLNTLTIGANRNTILKFLSDEKHPSVDIYESINYGSYCLGTSTAYKGDWNSGQKLILKR